jgi:hypothetical protein
MLKLNDDDGQAVDMLLEAGNGGPMSGNGGSAHMPVLASVPSNLQQRLAAASAVLQVLKELPAPEPSAQLLTKLLRAIEAAAGSQSSSMADGSRLEQPPVA